MSAKYPRTPHLPFSPGGTNDDKRMSDVTPFLERDVVVTEKMDGSNLCMTREHVYARSHSGPPAHPSFDAAKALHAQLRFQIPATWSVFGEWCYAVHSISYEALKSYFMVFGVRDDANGKWLSWAEVEAFAQEIGVSTVPVLMTLTLQDERRFEEAITELATQPSTFGGEREGVVVRSIFRFDDENFNKRVAKWVRADHVQTDDHWKHQEIRKQSLA